MGRISSVHASGSTFDTLITVYTGNAVNALTGIAFNDNSEGTLQSRITFNAVAGTIYRIAIDGYNSGSGIIQLTVLRQGGDKDFNGDGKSDILWRNDNGSVGIWLMNGAQVVSGPGIGAVGSDWTIVNFSIAR